MDKQQPRYAGEEEARKRGAETRRREELPSVVMKVQLLWIQICCTIFSSDFRFVVNQLLPEGHQKGHMTKQRPVPPSESPFQPQLLKTPVAHDRSHHPSLCSRCLCLIMPSSQGQTVSAFSRSLKRKFLEKEKIFICVSSLKAKIRARIIF